METFSNNYYYGEGTIMENIKIKYFTDKIDKLTYIDGK